MESVSLISRGNSDNQLLDYKAQVEFFSQLKQSKSDLLSIRKLREAIMASKRCDDFATTVYEYSTKICLENRNYPEAFKSLVQLLNIFYIRKPSNFVVPNESEFAENEPISRQDSGSAVCNSQSRSYEYLALFLLHIACMTPQVTNGDMISSLKRCQKVEPDYKHYDIGLRWFLAIKLKDFVTMREIHMQASILERQLIEKSMELQRPILLTTLRKAFYTLPLQFLKEYLLISDDSNSLLEDWNLKIEKEVVKLKIRKADRN